MSRGQIVLWSYTSNNINRGTIVGCFDDVHGQTFGFTIADVDAALAAYLRSHPNFSKNVDCSATTGVLWVTFLAEGSHAINISSP